jgi:hypothetical protein
VSRIVISDSSVLMDLAVGGLLQATTALAFEFIIPDVMLAEELLDLGGHTSDDLLSFGFLSGELSNANHAFILMAEHAPALSLNDCFALAMAEERSCTLLTGDRRLREISRERSKVAEVRGTLWITRLLFETQTISNAELRNALESISHHPRTRLPKAELRRQIDRLKT